MKKRIFYRLALLGAAAACFGLLLGWTAAHWAVPLSPLCAGGAALLAMLLGLAAVVSSWVTRRSLAPLEEFSVHSNPDGPPPTDQVYPELAPILEKLREQRRSLLARIEALEEERNATGIIIDNMQRELDRQRESFTTDISQLTALLPTISAYARQIGDCADPGEAQRLAELITRETGRMTALADDMLRLFRLDEAVTVPMSRVSLTSVCRETLTSLSLVAHRRGVSLKLVGPEVWTRGSAEMLAELMTCICENAIIYNHQEGSVLVETGADPAGKTVWAAVRDTGVGIPEEAFQRIFERFYRAENELSDQTGGTGLGLAIAKRLADFHQGSIGLESTPGKGSVFTVTLPAWPETVSSTAALSSVAPAAPSPAELPASHP